MMVLEKPATVPPASSAPLVRIAGLKMHFPVKGGVFLRTQAVCKAVDGISFDLGAGETVGLVGESGCGKTTLGKCVVRLLQPTAGHIEFGGEEITGLRGKGLRHFRRHVQMVFQDPAESLNPRHTVRTILEEPFLIHRIGDRRSLGKSIDRLLDSVGLPANAADKFPFEFSGGQRQRIGIARAIALEPQVVICDEPVSALDVSVRSQILNLLLDLQAEQGLSYLFIAHDLAAVKQVSDRVAVMYLGRIMELAPSEELYRTPRHAYTKALIGAIPSPDPAKRGPRHLLSGDVPSPIDPPAGCAFGHRMKHPRWEESTRMDLSLREVSPGHWVQPCPCCADLF